VTNSDSGTLLGHPKGLFVLFFAEMWERFSFYGMKALLIFYLTQYLFWSQGDASKVFAWYAGLVYATPILGGIVADKWIGARWSVVIGGIIIATGHFLLAFEPLPFFYSGLGCLVAGTGMLKPNISTQVGAQYRSNDERRDSAFTIFYMGINSGALLGPIVCGWLWHSYGFHYGFAAAGVGMVLGLIVYIGGMRTVVRRERAIAAEAATGQADGDSPQQREPEAPPTQPQPLPAGPHAPSQSKIYRDRSIMLVIICVFAILFWVGFEQAANVMNLWADQHSNLNVFRAGAPEVTLPGEAANTGEALADWRMGPEITQSINPLFIVILAPVFAFLWQFLQRRKRQPSTPLKMGIAMLFLTGAYLIMVSAAARENQHVSVPLSDMPEGLRMGEQGRVYSTNVEDDGTQEQVFYGATRLRWENGTLHMNGSLTDLDWMRALGVSSPEAYRETIATLRQSADNKAEEVRLGKKAGEIPRDATWEVQVEIPAEAGNLVPIAGWPTRKIEKVDSPIVAWDDATRTLTLTDTLNDRDEAQLLAAGAEPQFRDAVTAIYKTSSLSRVSVFWLFAFYFVLTVGELCLSPVGLSLVTKAAPPKYVGLFMGLWFFCTGFVANFAAHTVGGYWGAMTPTAYFMIFGVIGLIAAVIMLIMLRFLKPLLHGIH
jgi:POT family proton-dependent oligopeptide transporter